MNKSRKHVRNPELREVLSGVARVFNLGAPVAADDDLIVTVANMKNGDYTIAAQPDVARCLTLTHAVVAAGTDTVGTVTVRGTNIDGDPISEILTPSAGAVVTGLKAFKVISKITGAGWVIAGGNDTIKIGVAATLGLPFQIGAGAQVELAFVDGVYAAPTAVANGDISKCTVSVAGYDGNAKVRVLVSDVA